MQVIDLCLILWFPFYAFMELMEKYHCKETYGHVGEEIREKFNCRFYTLNFMIHFGCSV